MIDSGREEELDRVATSIEEMCEKYYRISERFEKILDQLDSPSNMENVNAILRNRDELSVMNDLVKSLNVICDDLMYHITVIS